MGQTSRCCRHERRFVTGRRRRFPHRLASVLRRREQNCPQSRSVGSRFPEHRARFPQICSSGNRFDSCPCLSHPAIPPEKVSWNPSIGGDCHCGHMLTCGCPANDRLSIDPAPMTMITLALGTVPGQQQAESHMYPSRTVLG